MANNHMRLVMRHPHRQYQAQMQRQAHRRDASLPQASSWQPRAPMNIHNNMNIMRKTQQHDCCPPTCGHEGHVVQYHGAVVGDVLILGPMKDHEGHARRAGAAIRKAAPHAANDDRRSTHTPGTHSTRAAQHGVHHHAARRCARQVHLRAGKRGEGGRQQVSYLSSCSSSALLGLRCACLC